MIDWRDPVILEELRRLRGAGWRPGQIAKRMNCTRNAIVGAIWRHIYMNPYQCAADARRKQRAARVLKERPLQAEIPRRWTEEALTEPYALRKLRRRMEKSL